MSTLRATIGLYPSRHDWHELDTAPLLDFVRQNHAHIRIEQPEPKATTPLPDTVFDLIIVPVVAYDSHNYRLGIGSGWYDKFLARLVRQIFSNSAECPKRGIGLQRNS